MIVIWKGIQRQYKTTSMIGFALDIVLNGYTEDGYKYTAHDLISNCRLYEPYQGVMPLREFLTIYPDLDSRAIKHCLANNVIPLAEYTYKNNIEMRRYMQEVVKTGIEKKIIIIDEIDRVFPPRFWHDKEQTEAVLGLWQDEKLFNYVLGTAHLGLSVDNIIRESMQVECITTKKNGQEYVGLVVINALKRKIYKKRMYKVSLVQRLFNTREPIK